MKTRFIHIVIWLLVSINVVAQSHPALENYLFNPVNISPSYAGRLSGSLSFSHDQQFIGVPGAPLTTSLFYDSMTKGRFGYNFSMMQNEVGPIQNFAMGLSTAYHLRISSSEYFSVGLKYTFNRLGIDLVSEQYLDPDDFIIVNGVIQKWYHNVDISGAYYGKYNYVGVTMRNAVQTSFFINQNYGAKVIHLYGGAEIPVSEHLDFLYSGLINISENSPVDVNAHFMARFYDYISSGVLLSPTKVGFVYSAESRNGFTFLYQYAYPLTEIRYISQQSHTACLRYHFKRAQVFGNRIVESPVFFL